MYSLAIYILSFVAIWFGSGFIISSLGSVAKNIRITPFALSFFVLGILTSIPELAVGLTAVNKQDTPIFVGNLIGGIPVIFLFVIPVLALFGNGIKLTHTLSKKSLLYTLLVIVAPSLMALDGTISTIEGVFLVAAYLSLFLVIDLKSHDKVRKVKSSFNLRQIAKLIFGAFLVFLSSQTIVSKTLYFSSLLHLSPFVVSILALSFGTNLPELSLAVRSVLSGKKEIALGDYLGSAAANTLLFGIFTIVATGEVVPSHDFSITFLFLLVGILSFYVVTVYKRQLSRPVALLLLSSYLAFVWVLLR